MFILCRFQRCLQKKNYKDSLTCILLYSIGQSFTTQSIQALLNLYGILIMAAQAYKFHFQVLFFITFTKCYECEIFTDVQKICEYEKRKINVFICFWNVSECKLVGVSKLHQFNEPSSSKCNIVQFFQSSQGFLIFFQVMGQVRG